MKITIAGVDRSTDYTPEELESIELVMTADSAEQGVGSAPVPTDDPTEEAHSGQQFLVEIGAATILDGFVGPVSRDRGGVSGGRQTLRYTVIDENALIRGHRAVKWKRPEETDRARILAAIDEFLGHLALDVSKVLNTNTETIPAKTYTTEEVFTELQADCGDPTAKVMFIENRRFHWHRQSEGDAAGLEIVATGADRSTTFELESASPPHRSKDGMDLVTDVLARNPTTGVEYEASDATAVARHDADGIRHQRLIEVEGATLAQLTTLANRMLDTYKTERITYEGEIGPLTAAQVAQIAPGSRITVTDPVWGLEESVQPIAQVRLKYRHPDRFMAALQLGKVKRLRSKPLKTTASSSSGTGGDVVGSGSGPCVGCPPFILGRCTETFPTDVEDGWGVSSWPGNRTWLGEGDLTFSERSVAANAASVAISDFVPIDEFTTREAVIKQVLTLPDLCGYPIELLFDVFIFPTDGGSWDTNFVVQFRDAAGANLSGASHAMGGRDESATANYYGLGAAPALHTDVGPSGVWRRIRWRLDGTSRKIKVWDTGDAEPGAWLVDTTMSADSNLGGGYQLSIETRGGNDGGIQLQNMTFVDGLCACGDEGDPVPVVGQAIVNEHVGYGDGSDTTFQTRFPYMRGSLVPRVDLQTVSVIETVPGTGQFSLNFAPGTTELIRVSYRVGVES